MVVTDDCSTDSTISILREYEQKYRLKYFTNIHALGFVKNFERAISLCEGEYIVLSDQDDEWFPSKIDILYSEMIACEIKYPGIPIIVHHDVYIVDENLKNNYGNRFIKEKGHIAGLKNLLFGNSVVQGASIMFNRKLKEICFPLPVNVPLHDLYMSYVCECFGIRKYISEPLMLYRQHATNQIGVSTSSFLERLAKYFNKQIILANEEEKLTLNIFAKKFDNELSKANKDTIRDYFEILGNRICFGNKVSKIIRHQFNSGGSVIKLMSIGCYTQTLHYSLIHSCLPKINYCTQFQYLITFLGTKPDSHIKLIKIDKKAKI